MCLEATRFQLGYKTEPQDVSAQFYPILIEKSYQSTYKWWWHAYRQKSFFQLASFGWSALSTRLLPHCNQRRIITMCMVTDLSFVLQLPAECPEDANIDFLCIAKHHNIGTMGRILYLALAILESCIVNSMVSSSFILATSSFCSILSCLWVNSSVMFWKLFTACMYRRD